MRRGALLFAGAALVAIAIAVAIGLAWRMRRGDEVAAPARATPIAAVDEESDAAALEDTDARADDGRSEERSGPWTISGRVVKAGGCEPLAGAAIEMSGARTAERPGPALRRRHVVSSADGRFEFAALPSRVPLRLGIDLPPFARRALVFELGEPPGSPRRDLGDIPLVPGCALVVRLVGPDGAPVSRGRVVLGCVSGFDPRRFEFDIEEEAPAAAARGRSEFAFDRVPPGKTSLAVQSPGFLEKWEEVILPRAAPLVVRLEKAPSLAGRVLSVDGAPIAGAVVTEGWGSESVPARTDAGGRFLLLGMQASISTVVVQAEGYGREVLELRESDRGGELEVHLFPEAIVSGTFVRDADGAPIADHTMSLCCAPPMKTDAAGRFEVRGLPPGKHRFWVADDDDDGSGRSSLRPEEIIVDPGGRRSDVVVRLVDPTRGDFAVTGKVAEAGSGAPVARANVSWGPGSSEGLGSVGHARSDPNGLFRMERLAAGRWSVCASAPGFEQARVEISIPTQADVGIPLRKAITGSVSGRVVDVAGMPVTGARVWACEFEEKDGGTSIRPVHSAPTASDGAFRLDCPAPIPGSFLFASHQGHAPGQVAGIDLGPGIDVSGIEIRLGEGGTVRGQVRDAKGEAFAGVDVIIALAAVHSYSRSVRSDAGGRFEFLHLHPGKHVLNAAIAGRLPHAGVDAEATEGGVSEADLVFPAGEDLAGSVKDAAGQPVEGAMVAARPASMETSTSTVTTASDGRFRLAGLAAGQASVTVSKTGFLEKQETCDVPGDATIVIEPLARIIGKVEAEGRTWFEEGKVNSDDGLEVAIDRSGRFFLAVPAGRRELVVEIPGLGKTLVEETVGPGERKEVAVRLGAAGVLVGAVIDEVSSEPLDQVRVILLASNGCLTSPPFEAHTNSEGAYRLESVPEGRYRMLVTHDRHSLRRAEGITVKGGNETRRDFALSAASGIRGRVTAAGRPARAIVYLDSSRETATGPDGWYEFIDVPQQQLRIEAAGQAAGGWSARIAKHVDSREAFFPVLDFSLDAVRLRGRVLRNGVPVSEALVTAQGAGVDDTDTTSEDGYFHLLVERPGKVHLSIGEESEQTELEIDVPDGAPSFTVDLELPARQDH